MTLLVVFLCILFYATVFYCVRGYVTTVWNPKKVWADIKKGYTL